ncbi:probable E3 SUMO-protein ligase RNF212 [Bufo gargarizans]|uniref:probable E3 SUMO-protein ligase RNF212 n=1 Tax=Bufo gargarizans TaxID=30331 RepID=UPI001CF59DDC|nr:probable E3 SUMO-protein ligase RNF212 [Bufo gargarizans]
MGDLVRCNICFWQPGRETSRFAISNCGHVFCERCLQKGKNEECGVCKSRCRTIFLSNETDPEIKMLFMDINVLCKKFSNELTQVVEFQGSHRNRLLAHYKRKIAKLEETIKDLTQQLQSCSLRASQSYSRQPSSSSLRNMDPTRTEDQYSPSVSQMPSIKKVEATDFTSSSVRKKNLTTSGPTRFSLISPPRSGLMDSYRSNTSGGSGLRSSVGSSQHNIFQQRSKSPSPTHQGSSWHLSGYRSAQILLQTPLPSQTSSARQPITLANILQRHL